MKVLVKSCCGVVFVAFKATKLIKNVLTALVFFSARV